MERFLDTFFKPAILASTWPAIAKGMLVTIEIAILVVITGLALGLFLALLRRLRYRLLDILIISTLAGVGEEILFRGACQPAFGPIIASLAFGLCHVGSRGTIVLGAWAALVGGFFAWLTWATAGLLAPILAHALYDALALSYIRWGQPAPDAPGEDG